MSSGYHTKSIEELIDNIRKNVPTKDLLVVPDNASVLDQLLVLQNALSHRPPTRSQREERRLVVREEWCERESKRSFNGVFVQDLLEMTRERAKMNFVESMKDKDIVEEIERRQRQRETKERGRRLKERKKEYKGEGDNNGIYGNDEWRKKRDEIERIRKETREKVLFEAQSKAKMAEKEGERERMKANRESIDRRQELERERRDQERQLKEMSQWRRERARRFEQQDKKISEYQERLEQQRKILERERNKKIEEIRNQRLERYNRMESQKVKDLEKLGVQLGVGNSGGNGCAEGGGTASSGGIDVGIGKMVDSVGGHGGIIFGPEPGMLRKKISGNMKEELDFYLSLEERNLGSGLKFMPQFHGSVVVDGELYIIMEDLTYGKLKPCVIDMKIGKQTWAPDAPVEKREKMEKKDKNSSSHYLGSRIIGFNRYLVEEDRKVKMGREITKMVSPDQYPKLIRSFFDNGKEIRVDVMKECVNQMERLVSWWEQQTSFSTYSSSLLVVYDGASPVPVVTVKVIDFAHVINLDGNSKDENFLFGLRSNLRIFTEIIEEETENRNNKANDDDVGGGNGVTGEDGGKDAGDKSVAPVHLDSVGGHNGIILGPEPGKLMKKISGSMKAELDFYLSLEKRNLSESFEFMPLFFGSTSLDGELYIIMEDLTYGKLKPCVIDMKIGKQTWAPDAPVEKREKMEKKDKNSSSHYLGSRIIGFNRYLVEQDQKVKMMREVTKMVSPDVYPQLILSFFNNGKEIRLDVMNESLRQMKRLLAWWEQQTSFATYSSSLLIVYDGASTVPVVTIKVIDFAHVIELNGTSTDENFLFGLRSNVKIFTEIINEEMKRREAAEYPMQTTTTTTTRLEPADELLRDNM
eukprot:TRINITY_DN1590_c0_g1_i17.p1 TRINITY_DN1590_c0_g1~~TRINITY_DN1590_c0_g1_i17.p1  ORF type:complete len:868 (-),score=278.55 TRINITY_DN1590_c0_g1_i17:163-2766(-)